MNKLDANDVYTYDPCFQITEKDREIYDEHMQGAQVWYKNGVFYRDGDQPAVVFTTIEVSKWYTNGLLHREDDLPAVMGPTFCAWYVNGKRHRENDKPARIAFLFGVPATQAWYVNGKLHRETVDPLTGLLLPAYRYLSISEYYLNGVQVNEHGEPI